MGTLQKLLLPRLFQFAKLDRSREYRLQRLEERRNINFEAAAVIRRVIGHVREYEQSD
jgi:hypothetical protein